MKRERDGGRDGRKNRDWRGRATARRERGNLILSPCPPPPLTRLTPPHPTHTAVDTSAILLKPNMILPGLDAPTAGPATVAAWTVDVLRRTIPACVPGIHFLSGGMSEEESTLNLQALQDEAAKVPGGVPWALTFSYGRALQSTTLKTWAGQAGNVKAAQDILVALAQANSQAQLGKYAGPHPVPGGGRILQALRLGGAGK